MPARGVAAVRALQRGSEKIMNKIDDEKHNELIVILSELIETIELMKKEEKDYLLIQNENEARDWMDFLKNHTDNLFPPSSLIQ